MERLGKLLHIGIAVEDLSAAGRLYGEVFGFEVKPEKELGDRGLRVLMVDTGNTVIELLAGTRPDSAISRFIEKRGPGIHHLCFAVDDIEAALMELSGKGMRLIDEEPRTGADGHPVAFLHPASTDKVLIELEQRPSVDADGR